jgi:ligand-binding sensor domain-containing protein
MFTLRKIFILLFIPFTIIAQTRDVAQRIAEVGQPFITTLSAKTYRSHPNNYDVVQDKNGILYFGNLWCVLQFDGTIWRKIPLSNGSSCTALALDDDGTIYVGGRNSIGYLKTDSIGRKQYVSLVKELPVQDTTFNEIWKIAVSPEGVYFSSYEKLFFKDRRGGRLKIIRNTPWFVFRVSGKTYLTEKAGLFFIENGKIDKVPNAEFFEGKYINAMTSFRDQLLISTSEAGIYFFDGKKAERWNVPLNETLRSSNPTRIQNINDKHLIVSTELNGVFIVDLQGNIISHFHKGNGLPANTVSGFYLDRSNILWLTTYNGIVFVPMFKQINFINDYAGVNGIPYSSAVYDGKLYLATSEGLFFKPLDRRSRDDKFSRVEGVNGLVWNLSVVDDKLFCGHAISSLMIDHGKLKTILDEGTWLFIPCRENGTILMGTYSGLHYLRKVNGNWSYDKKIKGLHVSARYFIQDRLGDLWVSNGNAGVLKLRLNSEGDSVVQTKLFDRSNGFPHEQGNTIVELNDEIFISTVSGIYTYDFEREQLHPADRINLLLKTDFHTDIKKLIAEPPDKLWLIDNEGSIGKLQLSKDTVKFVFNTDLLRGNLISVFEHLHPIDNLLIAGSLDGFALYDQNPSDSIRVPLHAFVTRLETSRHLLLDGNFELTKIPTPVPHAENALKFTFASSSYQDLTKNQYQYYLEGFQNEKEWGKPTYIPYKEYTNLHAGSYTLHLRVVNFENRISDEAILAFEVLPPWYLTWWAYLLYAMVFTVVNYFIFKGFQRRVEREKKRVAQEEQHILWLKQKEWDETNLSNERAMMQLQHEKLAMEQAALEQKQLLIEQEKESERQILEMEKQKLEADLQHKNTELTSLTLHIAQRNEMINKIANQLNKTIEESTDQVAITNLKDIKTSLQKGLISDQDWERFTDHFDTVHEGFLKRLKQQYPDLSSSTLKLCAFIKMRLSAKQIATLMNTAPDSVLKARYRLRTKFNLEKETGLEEFLNNF